MNPEICPRLHSNQHACRTRSGPLTRAEKHDAAAASRGETDVKCSLECPLISSERRVCEWEAAAALSGSWRARPAAAAAAR